ncbi:MAG: carbohydrate ABC transporter permease [Anaerolineae bacterium]
MTELAKPRTGPIRWSKERTRKAIFKGIIYLLCILVGAFQILPMVWMVSGSLKKPAELFRYPPMWIPKSWQWSNYAEMWTSLQLDGGGAAMPRYMWNTIVITTIVLIGVLLSNTLVGFGFARLRARGKDVLFIILLTTMMLPAQMTWLSVYIIMSRLPYPTPLHYISEEFNRVVGAITGIGFMPSSTPPTNWIDTYLPLTVPSFFASPGTVFLLRQFFLTVPIEMDEAARIDGASTLRIYWSIFLPQAKPVLAAVTILTFIGQWKEYFRPLLYLNTSDKFPIALGIQYFRGFADYATQWHLLMAAGTVLSIPPLIIFLIFQRYFVQGMSLTGLKG